MNAPTVCNLQVISLKLYIIDTKMSDKLDNILLLTKNEKYNDKVKRTLK